MTFPKTTALLQDPDIWIADSAASTHSTGHLQGLIKLKPGESSDAIQVGNSSLNNVKYIGDLPGKFYDQFGDVQHSATL
jgi:hypothetical protein